MWDRTCARGGDFVDSVGRNTETIRRYIQQQEAEDQHPDQMESLDS
jgi:REP element-mobilizing transposase RayT